MGAAYLLERMVGLARATEILMLGDPVPAARCLEWGLANRVTPKDRVLAEARSLAERLAEGPPLGLRLTKRMLNNEWNMDLSTAIESEAQAQALMMMGEDHAEYHRAFVEKRRPRFRGE
jgi:enoyl-CoA hydratase/carnithine racemase